MKGLVDMADKSDKTRLRDKLSRLNYTQACRMLGQEGVKMIAEGGKRDIDIAEQVVVTPDTFKVETANFTVQIDLDPVNPKKLRIQSSTGRVDCVEVAAVLSLILEEKMALGLAKPPPERVPVESLSPADLREEALRARRERAAEEKYTIIAADESVPWTDYAVTNPASGKTYKVALRGVDSPETYCSCPDFKVNHLGICKHIIHLAAKVKKKFPVGKLKQAYVRVRTCLTVCYGGGEPELRLLPGSALSAGGRRELADFIERPIADDKVFQLLQAIEAAGARGDEVNIYPDAEEFVNTILFRQRIARLTDEIRRDPANHPLLDGLLKVKLRPYQLEGIAFVVGRGRAILADDMGLGKTIQGIGAAELFAREARVGKVLIVCPTSLKSQWEAEIHKFTERQAQQVLGSAEERAAQYANDAFFTICNYEQVLRDLKNIEEVKWDLIILDEAQRIKNWESKTSQMVRSLKSQYALALTGTPMENRLEELYNVVSFIDVLHIGPAYKFLNTHRMVDEKGKVLGYKNLEKLRKLMQPLLLRRIRDMVLTELPERQTEVVMIDATEEQAGIDSAQRRIAKNIVSKAFISEMDLLRLQKALLTARMAADSTYLVDKKMPHYSSKLEKLRELIGRMVEAGRKIVLFSEWTTMLGLIEDEVIPSGVKYVRLDGSVPQKARGALVKEFMTDPECRLFITTNAGSTGLNLQAADTVINVDLPWNPAILEQRIARAHRMGQKNPVQVYLLVTAGTIEEQMLGTLGAKRELFHQALEQDASEDSVLMTSGIDELKRRLEQLFGVPDDTPIDESRKRQVEQEIAKRHKQSADAAGKLFAAAFEFLGAASGADSAAADSPVAKEIADRLADCATANEEGGISLKINLPEQEALGKLAQVFAGILAAAPGGSAVGSCEG